ncbi:UNVERIFIED_CONTAM: hypothetical protein FO487_14885 [Bacillus amyloliquefaciens DSM 7 = ATCC 23350]|nr:hypothetical protein [Bacillus amyloliquefaciens]OXL22442.1 hypothetical protein CFI04_03290 [Bacillus amyloliquefaciens]QDP91482.1 hypothetical protein FOG69_04940 [Bacillus amyloliquefaciens]RDY86941.1 hypothetical protein C3733_14725 [Bacillus amyloliquefaciens]RHX70709.1 hypothetical protein D0A23_01300 [Bacillus amyloliquefaciens]
MPFRLLLLLVSLLTIICKTNENGSVKPLFASMFWLLYQVRGPYFPSDSRTCGRKSAPGALFDAKMTFRPRFMYGMIQRRIK